MPDKIDGGSMAFLARLLLWVFIGTGGAIAATNAVTPPPLRFGSVAMDTPVAMQERLSKLTRYLSESIHRPVVLKLSSDMQSAIDAIANGDVDVAYLTPVAYVNAHEQGKVKLLVKTITENEPSLQLMVVVRDNSVFKTIADLKGKRFAFGDRSALLQRAVVVDAGLPLESLGEYRFLGHYDNVVRGVLNGDYDAGILKDTTTKKWMGKGIRPLYTSPPLPPYNIAVSASLDNTTYEQLKRALLALSPSNVKQHEIIRSLDTKYSGFKPAVDSEYDVVRRLIKPFANERSPAN
jgi:phosphonate transport system substrate-binding protein